MKYFCVKLYEYIISTVGADGLVLERLGISNKNAEYATLAFHFYGQSLSLQRWERGMLFLKWYQLDNFKLNAYVH